MLDIQKLEKSFGEKRAVQGLSFTVEKGTVLGFLGPNGAGKSTTMRMIAGVLERLTESQSSQPVARHRPLWATCPRARRYMTT